MYRLGDTVSGHELLDDIQARGDHQHFFADGEGDLDERLLRYDAYRLLDLDLSILDLNEWERDDDQIEEYIEQLALSEPPPLIVHLDDDPKGTSIVDGLHRANALVRAGRTHHQAWVQER